jgi:hypothetical protein
VCIWTPDKDLAQCVQGDRVVQVDRRSKEIRNADGVRAKFGIAPERIPDYLALVGDAADGYPGLPGIGKVGAARLIGRYGALEDFPERVLGSNKDLALLFKHLATLKATRPCLLIEELLARAYTRVCRGVADRSPGAGADQKLASGGPRQSPLTAFACGPERYATRPLNGRRCGWTRRLPARLSRVNSFKPGER